MSKTTPAHEHVPHEPEKAGCCGGEHGKGKKAAPTLKEQPVPSEHDKLEPAQHAHSGSCGCGSSKANK
ncbi:hypothetical protein [Hyphomicrobium sp. 2TAF46]|uniref:hypothetical protein n=1 Tax=Hyphomicrobium sp. 2TAF46 TaxID=3233019 RepID=UPI003F937590